MVEDDAAISMDADPFGGTTGMKREELEAETAEIQGLVTKVSDNFLALACRLRDFRQKLPHGAWGAWVKAKLPFGVREAQTLLSIAETWLANPQLADAPADVIKALLAPSVPKELRNQIVDEIQEGKIPTAEEIKARKTRNRKPSPAVDVMATAPSVKPTPATPMPPEGGEFATEAAEPVKQPEVVEAVVAEPASGMRITYYGAQSDAQAAVPEDERGAKVATYQGAVAKIKAAIPDFGTVSAEEVGEHNLLELEAEQDYDALVKYHLGEVFRFFPNLSPDWADVEPYVKAIDALMDQVCKAFDVVWDKSGRKHGAWRN